jgi:hypothetical protein
LFNACVGGENWAKGDWKQGNMFLCKKGESNYLEVVNFNET